MSTPVVPPRPSARAAPAQSASAEATPQIPPRPTRKIDPSPIRDVRSPLNEIPNPIGNVPPEPSKLSVEDVPARPPSVSLPSIGQEGSEYATYDMLPAETSGVSNEVAAPEQTRNVSEEMPLHAPRASLPQSTAKSRIETVTGTDSTQAAAAGIGKARPDDDVHKTPADSTGSLERPASSDPGHIRRKSGSRPASGTPHASRPGSVYEDFHEHGIPHHGLYAPLNPNAGDVQAPSPGPTQSPYPQGIGYFNDGSARAHTRKKSGRQEFGPPGSYGLHSHSAEPHDKFDKEWYAKNRDKAAQEELNRYGRPKPETALSSAELNRIVTQTEDAGPGTPGNAVSTPGEEMAFTASDAYAARLSPKTSPVPHRERRKRPSSGSQPAVESPLRRTSYPFPKSSNAVEDDDVDVIHIDSPEYRTSKVTGGGPADAAVDLGAHAGNTEEEGGWFVERGSGTPILASDEVLKRHESSTMQPAVNPEYHFDSYDEYAQYDNRRRSRSRPSSRPSSIHGDYQGGNLHRFISHEDPRQDSHPHTPLEEIEEYEPLIPEGQDVSPKPKSKDIKRRPGVEHHHFPSRDVWEDTPSSMYYHTTVEHDQTPLDESPTSPTAARKVEPSQASREIDSMEESSRPVPKQHYSMRTAGPQRFPSKDIWEDTPTSLQFSTTVGGPQMDETRSPPDDRPTTSAIPGSQDDGEARATTGFTQNIRPSIPARPQRRSKLAEEMKPGEEEGHQESLSREVSSEEKPPSSPEKTKAPPIPDRPKPTVPVRPARSSRSAEQTNGAGAELAKAISNEAQSSTAESATSPPVPKTKPAVPARPGGEKLAALKAGFMSDLNNRLKLGPQAPPTKSRELEPEAAEEAAPKAPLADARKGRAKGPARRKPAASPSASSAAEEKAVAFSIADPVTVWAIDETENVVVPSSSSGASRSSPVEPTIQAALTEQVSAHDMAAEKAQEKAALAEQVSAHDMAAEKAQEKAADAIPSTSISAPAAEAEKALAVNEAENTEEEMPEPVSAEKAEEPVPSSEGADLAAIADNVEDPKAIQTRLRASLADIGAGPAVDDPEKSVVGTAEVVGGGKEEVEASTATETIAEELEAGSGGGKAEEASLADGEGLPIS